MHTNPYEPPREPSHRADAVGVPPRALGGAVTRALFVFFAAPATSLLVYSVFLTVSRLLRNPFGPDLDVAIGLGALGLSAIAGSLVLFLLPTPLWLRVALSVFYFPFAAYCLFWYTLLFVGLVFGDLL